MSEPIEESVESFLDIESDLQELGDPGVATPAISDVKSGSIVGAERAPADSVPEGYPVPIDGDSALALEVRVDVDTTAVVFLDWPDDGRGFGQIEQLLSETGVAYDSFADIYGEELPLAVRDGFLVAALQYDGDRPYQLPEAADRPIESEPGAESTADRQIDDAAANQIGFVTICTLAMTWVLHGIASGGDLTLVWGILAFAIGVFFFGAVASDREWINATTDRELASWWPVVVPLVPPVAAPLYLVQRYRARFAARLPRTKLADVHRTNQDLGRVVSHYDGKDLRLVVLEGGVRIQSLDDDPRGDAGATFSYGDFLGVTTDEDTDRYMANDVELTGIRGSRDLIGVEFPEESNVVPSDVAHTIRRQKLIWEALQATRAEPETLATSDSAVAVLTDDGVRVSRQDHDDAFIPLEHVGDVGIDYEKTTWTSDAPKSYRRPYAYFEDSAVKTVGKPVVKAYCEGNKAEFRAFVETVASRTDGDAEPDGDAR